MNNNDPRSQLNSLDGLVTKLRIKPRPEAELVRQLSLTREFLSDRASLGSDAFDAKWGPRFKEFYDAQLAVGRLFGAVSRLSGQPESVLRQYLTKILAGSLTQNFDPQEARDLFYELEVAATLTEAGYDVSLEEPDIVVSGMGLSQRLGIACKYPSSEKQIHPHLNKGYAQIERHGFVGLVALGLDQVALRELLDFTYVDFRQGRGDPLRTLQNIADDHLKKIVGERPDRFPAEVPADGLLVTLTAGGISGNPAGLVAATVLSLGRKDGSPAYADIGRIYASLQSSLAGRLVP